MSGRSDRSRPGSGRLALAAAALVLCAAGVAGLLWSRGGGEPQPAVTTAPGPQAPVARPDEPFPATIFAPVEGRLAATSVPVKRQPDAQLQARETAAALLDGGQAAVLKEFRLRALYLDASGTAVVDLLPRTAAQKEVRAPVADELLALYAVVNTVMHNVPDVRQVRIILDGRESPTLAGHIDLSRSFVKRTDLVRTP